MKTLEQRPHLRDSLGLIVTAFSAVGLALVLWQVAKLNHEAGLSAASMARERMAVTMSGRMVDSMRSLRLYQRTLALGKSPAMQAALQARVSAQIGGILRDFRTGDAASIAPTGGADTIAKKWGVAKALRGRPAVDAVSTVVYAMETALGGMEDASGLTYDPSVIAQNLADVRIIEMPIAISTVGRIRTLSALALKNGNLTLEERLRSSNSVNALRTVTDLSSDHIPAVSQQLGLLIPEHAAEYGRLPGLANGLYHQADAYARVISNQILLKTVPSIRLETVTASSQALDQSAASVFNAFGTALDQSLERRGEIARLRNRYYYLAFLLGAVLLVGIMMVLAQVVARRDRSLLRLSQKEAARLTAELARQHAEEALRLSEAQFRAVFDGAAIGIAVLDRSGSLVDANDVFRSMFGDSISTALAGHEDELAALLSGERETFEFEQHVSYTAEHDVWTDATLSIVHGPPDAPLFAIAMFRDKTELKHSERRMQHDKLHDALTGLPNRQLFEEHLRRRFDEATALLDSFFAVLFIDLEHFKDINESMGHAAGDLALTQMAQRVRSAVDARDIVARHGSDEFTVLVQSLGDILHVESIARRILNNLSRPVPIGANTVYLGASVGIAIGSSGYERAEDVMRDAEIAMQHAKSTGGTRYALFDSKMHARAQQRLQLTTDLRLAIERHEFRLLYQPIVTLHDSRLVGCEALIRWDHPNEGVLNPTDFIPLSEQTGLATPIGHFVIQTAAEQLAVWRRNRNGSLNFTMNVNVSAAEVADPDFERFLVQVIERNGCNPSDFTIEITENVVLDPGTRANFTLERVRDRGFNVCIDDFGTGYSSLRYLQQFKVDAIKIDRSFVAGADGELASEPIVRTLMTLAEAFDVKVVAEGVETARQRDVLRNAGCRLAQGYLYARPLSAAEMVSLYPEVLGRLTRSALA